MKKIAIIVILIICFGVGCSYKNVSEKVDTDDVYVTEIRAFKIQSSLVTVQKMVTDKKEILEICDVIGKIDNKKEKWKEPSQQIEIIGLPVFLFRIYISNGDIHDIKFVAGDNGRQELEIDGNRYMYEGDYNLIRDLWNNLSEEGKIILYDEVWSD